jgi:hypothetical protein
MATLSNVTLMVGRAPAGAEFAEVSYDVEFGKSELEHDIAFDELVLLFEQDEGPDLFQQQFVGTEFHVLTDGDRDDAVGTVFEERGSLIPRGRRTVHRVHRREWEFPRNESGPEEYRALVIVRPQVWRGTAWSNEVSANLR